MGGRIEELRRAYHRRLFQDVLRQNEDGVPNNSDSGSAASIRLGRGIVGGIGIRPITARLAGQTAGHRFEEATRDFLREAFEKLAHIRPGEWEFGLGGEIGDFEQYMHLSDVSRIVEENKDLRVVFGDYIVRPDIVVGRRPVSDGVINQDETLLGNDGMATHTPLRETNSEADILHASVSCKWTIRSDRSQNARTEGLNLVRTAKARHHTLS